MAKPVGKVLPKRVFRVKKVEEPVFKWFSDQVKKSPGLSSTNEKQVGGKHYQTATVQHWDFVHMHKMPYMEAQIFKYVLRHREKGGVQDLEKAKHFLEKLIEQETK